MPRTPTTLAAALRILSRDLHCEDGVATAVIAEAAEVIDRGVLTEAERQAVWDAAEAYGENDDDPECERIATALHGLWQRTAQGIR